MPWKRTACGCLAVLVAACHPDSPSITEVEGTLDHHPERTSCHFEPEAITTIDGQDEVVLIEFTYGGGETWSDPPGQCGEDPGPDLQGLLLASHGVSYSDSIGGDGDFYALSDCSLSGAFGRPCNVPSLPNALWIDALLGSSGYLRFDPPVSELSFRVCSSQSHGLTAWDSLGNQIVPETVGPSNGTSVDTHLHCDSEGWEEFGIQASGYNISKVRLRRWDPGLTYWDDMTFRREAPPGIVCDTTIRGSPTTCRVRPEVLLSLDSVRDWSFEARFEHNQQVWPIDGPDQDTVWTGVAVTGGTAFATGVRGNDSLPLHGDLVVHPRTEGWNWNQQEDWDFDDFEGRQGCTNLNWGSLKWIQGTLQAVLAYNLRKSECWPGSIDPSPVQLPDDHFEADSVVDGGPNHGLHFVKSVDYKMIRGSLLNPEMHPSAPTKEISKKDSGNCPDSLRVGSQSRAVVNFHIYNETCMEHSLAPLRNGILRHEAFGTGGQLNGHEAQRRIGAAMPENNPYAVAEAVVDRSYSFLRISVGNAVFEVDQIITEWADGEFHIVVNQNFQEPAFIEHNNGQFHSQVLDDH